MKHKLKAFLSLSIFLGIFYLYILCDSLDIDYITLGQAMVRGGITSVYLVIATVTYIKAGKEEDIYEEDR